MLKSGICPPCESRWGYPGVCTSNYSDISGAKFDFDEQRHTKWCRWVRASAKTTDWFSALGTFYQTFRVWRCARYQMLTSVLLTKESLLVPAELRCCSRQNKSVNALEFKKHCSKHARRCECTEVTSPIQICAMQKAGDTGADTPSFVNS